MLVPFCKNTEFETASDVPEMALKSAIQVCVLGIAVSVIFGLIATHALPSSTVAVSPNVAQ
jgi:hypothetical protein